MAWRRYLVVHDGPKAHYAEVNVVVRVSHFKFGRMSRSAAHIVTVEAVLLRL